LGIAVLPCIESTEGMQIKKENKDHQMRKLFTRGPYQTMQREMRLT